MQDVPTATDPHILLRNLPSVDRLLQDPATTSLVEQYGRPLATEAFRHVLEERRQAMASGRHMAVPSPVELIGSAAEWLDAAFQTTLRPVINGTGVIVHTNLGRAPLSRAAVDAIARASTGYATLEYDIEAGKRGSRTVHAEQLLTRLTGAEAALVVNNAAASCLCPVLC
ncbi:MAG: hypothetical protein R3C44_13095 [Chloroflexota bacterium]